MRFVAIGFVALLAASFGIDSADAQAAKKKGIAVPPGAASAQASSPGGIARNEAIRAQCRAETKQKYPIGTLNPRLRDTVINQCILGRRGMT